MDGPNFAKWSPQWHDDRWTRLLQWWGQSSYSHLQPRGCVLSRIMQILPANMVLASSESNIFYNVCLLFFRRWDILFCIKVLIDSNVRSFSQHSFVFLPNESCFELIVSSDSNARTCGQDSSDLQFLSSDKIIIFQN